MPKITEERIIDAGAGVFTPGTVGLQSAGRLGGGSHLLATSEGLGDQHTVFGLTAGQVLQATSAATAAFAVLTHSELSGITANQHHNQSHVLASTNGLGADHTVAGLTAGQYLRASGATDASFAAILDADIPATIVRTSLMLTAGDGLTGLGDLSANRTISVELSATSGLELAGVSPDKTLQIADTVAGNGLTIASKVLAVGVSGLGLSVGADAVTLTSSSDPGAAASILASDATGKLAVPLVVASTSLQTPLIIAGAGQSLTIQPPLDLYLNPTGNVIRISGNRSLQSDSFGSGFAGYGWRVDYGVTSAPDTTHTNAEFDNLTVRGMLKVYELVIQQIRATNGSVFVTSAAKIETVTLVSGSIYDLTVDGETNDYQPFAVGDVIRAQRVNLGALLPASPGLTDFVWRSDLVVTAINVGGDAKKFRATWQAGSTVPAAKMEFVRLGNASDITRQGAVYLTSDDSGAPFIDIVNGITSHADWNTAGKIKVRLGKLDGIVGGTNEYGLIAGNNGFTSSDTWLKASSAGVVLNNVPLDFRSGGNIVMALSPNSGAPYMALGSPLPTGPLVGDGIWLGKDGAVYELRVGTVSDGVLVKGMHWDGANLVWKATNTSLNADGNLTATSATLTGQITANTGYIGTAESGWVIAAGQLTSTNIGLYAGASARLQVGSDSDIAGIAATAVGTDIAFWAGDTYANRASAEFRVRADGQLYATGATLSGAITATSGTISGDLSVTSGGKLTASGGGIVLTATGINIGLYDNIDGGETPSTEARALAWYDTPGTATGLRARQYVGKSDDGAPHWNVTVGPAGSNPLTMTLWAGPATSRGLWFANLTSVSGIPGVAFSTGSPNLAQIMSGTRLQLDSGSTFVAYSHLLPGEDFPTTAYNLGSALKRWGTVYANNMVISGSISGTQLGGQTWTYPGDMVIDAAAAMQTTVTIGNSNATYGANLSVEGTVTATGFSTSGHITVGGNVDGVDVSAFKSAYDSHNHDSRYYTETELQTSGSATVHWGNLSSKPTTFAPSAHAYDDAVHTGSLSWSKVNKSGSNLTDIATRSHTALSDIGTNTHAQIDTHIGSADTHVAHSGVDFTAGAGLTGGGTIAASRSFAVGAGLGITVNADDVALTTPGSLTATSTNSSTGSHTHAIDATIARSAITMTAGNGFAAGSGGDLTANRTFTLGTPGALSATTTDAVTTNSHTHSISTAAATTLTVATTNAVGSSAALARADHTHAITTSSAITGATASILASDANGYLRLQRLGLGRDASYPLDVNGIGRFSGGLYADDILDVDGAAQFNSNLYVGTNVLYVDKAGTRVGINRIPDSQFSLDVAGAIRGDYIIGKHAIQLSSAVGVFHFDGPAPYNLNFNGTNVSHMGKSGTETGHILYRSGKFGKAIQIASTATNLIKNPNFKVDAAGWSGQGATAVTAFPFTAPFGTSAAVVDPVGMGNGASYNATQNTTAGGVYSASIYLYPLTTATFYFWLYDDVSGGSYTAFSSLPINQWTRIAKTHTFGANSTFRAVMIQNQTSTADFIIAAAQLETGALITPYHDGDLTSPESWDGTSNSSTSTRVAGNLTYSLDPINYDHAQTIMGWFYFQSVAHNYGYLWNYLQLPDHYAAYYSASALFVGNVNCGTVPTGWHHIAWSTAGDGVMKAYVDGLFIGSTNLDRWTTGDISLGSLNGYYCFDGLIDDFVILDYAADAKLIRAIFESDAPVFVESSVFHWRAPGAGNIWVDERGFWATGLTNDPVFGIYTGDPAKVETYKSWGGVNLEDNDVLIGRTTGGGSAIHWDDSQKTLRLGTQGAEHLALTGTALQFMNATTEMAKLDGATFTLGNTAGSHVAITSSAIELKYGSNTPAISLNSDGNASFTGTITANSGSIAGALTMGASGSIVAGDISGQHISIEQNSINFVAVSDAGIKAISYRNGVGSGYETGYIKQKLATSGSKTAQLKYYGASFDFDSTILATGVARLDGGLRIGGDPGAGSSGQVSLSNQTSGVSTGTGTVKMGSSTNENSTGWMKIYVEGNARYIPYWSVIAG